MRESLTILAIAVILLLSALLVGPYFIDWSNQREFLAGRLSKAVGAKVTIAGAIDVKLLPRPIFRVGDVSIEGAAPQDPRVAVKTLDAELSINGLLQGAVEFVDATVLSPRFDVTVRSDGSVVGAPFQLRKAQAFQFKHININDGSVVVRDEDGAERLSIGGLNAQGEADSLIGPFKFAGTLQQSDTRIAFRLNTGAFGSDRLRVKLTLDGADAVSRVDADGFIIFAALPTGGHAIPGYEGSVNLAGAVHVADGAAPVPWRAVISGVKSDRQSLTATAIELRAGIDGRALVANGGGFLDLGQTPAAVVQLRARQLDLDRLAVPPDVAPDTPRPTAAQWAAALKAFGGGAEGTGLPLNVSVNLGIDAVTVGDLTLTDAGAVLDRKRDGATVGRVTLAGPEGTRLVLDGSYESGVAPGFKGHAELATRELARVVGWFGPLWPEAAGWIGTDPPVHAIDFTGALTASTVGLVSRDMRLTLDGSTFGGTFALTGGVAGERPRLFADLTADRLDAAHLPNLSSFAAAAAPLDLSIGLAAKATRFSGSALEPIDTGQLALHLTKTADAIALDQFSITGFGGAAVTATASVDPAKRLRTEGRIDAKAVAPLAGILRQIAPGAVTDLLATHAAPLSPLSLAFKVEGALDADGGLIPSLASGEGTAGTVRVVASFTPEAAQKYSASPLKMTIKVDAADAGAALRQWGVAGAGPLGAGHAEIAARGTLKDGFEATASAALADATASFAGRLGPATGSGHIKANGASAANLLRTAGIAGPGNVSAAPWDAEGDLDWGEGRLSIAKLASHVNGTSIAGALTLKASPPSTDAPSSQTLGGALTLDAVSLRSLAGLALTVPSSSGAATGEIWSKTKFGAMGTLPRSDIALKIGSLDIMPGLMARDTGLTLRIAPGVVTLADLKGQLLGGMARGTMMLRRDGPSGSLSGQVAVSGVPFALPSLAGRLSATLDLASSGTSPDALIGSLAGEGPVSIAGARMPRLDADALNRVAKRFDAEGASVDDGGVREVLDAELDKGALAFGDIAASATVAAGTLRVLGLETKAAGYTATSEGALDLRDLELTVKTTVTTTQIPKDWKGDAPQVTVTWAGPLSTPRRTVDAAAFVNGLAARAIARDQERIEMMQSDIRERAFFARRLRQIEAEQQAVRDAAQIQKMIPVPPRPGDLKFPKGAEGTTSGSAAPGRAQPGGRTAPLDDEISKFLNGSGPIPPAKLPLPPMQLQSPARGATSPAPNAAAPDPSQAGSF